ncbi:aquaporin [Saccharothrix deserti]|uniref:aquaporin n=1 Tax=Saccharothrix deserti TaxID=2593674 RepID=UPI00131B4EDA|nr:aquaporin [Saccharothrix deserti]
MLLFVVVSLVRRLAFPGSSLAIGTPHTLFAVAGIAVAAVIAALMYSPPGDVGDGQAALRVLIPAVIGIGVGVVIAILGIVTGASINPARAFGPALRPCSLVRTSTSGTT